MKEKLKRIVVKFGTQSLMKGKKLFQSHFNNVARQVVALQKDGIEVAIVSSGAIQAGKEKLTYLKMENLAAKYIAGVGMKFLLDKWQIAFWSFYKRPVAQVLITHANFKDPKERESIKKGILNYMQYGILPIINENDVVSDIEIVSMRNKISENDILASKVAQFIKADAILFITDVGGIYNDDPKNPNAKLYNKIDINNPPSELKISNIISQNGRGGMAAKLKVGSDCSRAGMYTVISGLKEDDSILKFARKEPVGTLLVNNAKKLSLVA